MGPARQNPIQRPAKEIVQLHNCTQYYITEQFSVNLRSNSRPTYNSNVTADVEGFYFHPIYSREWRRLVTDSDPDFTASRQRRASERQCASRRWQQRHLRPSTPVTRHTHTHTTTPPHTQVATMLPCSAKRFTGPSLHRGTTVTTVAS